MKDLASPSINNNENNNTMYSLPKPLLFKRMLAGILDLLFFVILFIGLKAGSFFTVFKSLGYQDMIYNVQKLHADCALYVKKENEGYKSYLDIYNEDLTPEENLDVPITKYYTYDSRAINDNKLVEYNNIKLSSGYYELDEINNKIVRKSSTSNIVAKEFLTTEFKKAINYFESNPQYIHDVNTSHNIMLYGSIIILIISSLIIYLLPTLFMYHVTFGQMIFKMGLANSDTNKLAGYKEVFIRFLVFALVNILCPFLLFLKVKYIFFIPILITTFMMTWMKNNLTIHDYLSHTYIVEKYAVHKENKNEEQ